MFFAAFAGHFFVLFGSMTCSKSRPSECRQFPLSDPSPSRITVKMTPVSHPSSPYRLDPGAEPEPGEREGIPERRHPDFMRSSVENQSSAYYLRFDSRSSDTDCSQ
jgi:hypothetical protein